MLVKYKGNLGTETANEFGKFKDGETKDLPPEQVAALVATGCFEAVNSPSAPPNPPAGHVLDNVLDKDGKIVVPKKP